MDFSLREIKDAFYKPTGYNFAIKKIIGDCGGQFFKLGGEWYIRIPQENREMFENQLGDYIIQAD